MSRRRSANKREVTPDPVYNSYLVSNFISCIMKDGKKGVAEKILYGALEALAKKEPEKEVLEIFETAINNVLPMVEVKSRRVGGSTYQVPIEVRKSRGTSLAIRWLIRFASARSGKSIGVKLADELYDAFQQKGGSVKKREDTHKMAEANRAFAHYRW